MLLPSSLKYRCVLFFLLVYFRLVLLFFLAYLFFFCYFFFFFCITKLIHPLCVDHSPGYNVRYLIILLFNLLCFSLNFISVVFTVILPLIFYFPVFTSSFFFPNTSGFTFLFIFFSFYDIRCFVWLIFSFFFFSSSSPCLPFANLTLPALLLFSFFYSLILPSDFSITGHFLCMCLC